MFYEWQATRATPSGLGSRSLPADTWTSDSDVMHRSDYNYERFDAYVAGGAEQREFAAFPDHLHAGDQAPEISGVLLDDRNHLALSEVWRRRTVVVEFGSFT